MAGAERRQEILRVALRAFAELGYHGASMAEMASEVGITKAALYVYFPSKQELFVELLGSIRDELLGRGREAMAARAPLRERLRGAVDAFFAFAEERPAALRILLSVPRGEPELREAVRRVQAEATERLAELLASNVKGGDGVPVLAVEFMKQGLHGMAEWWADHPKVRREALVEAVVGVVWDGLRAWEGRGEK